MKHPTKVEKYSGTSQELAKDIGRMRYDAVAEFYNYLGDDLMEQARADRARGNIQLAGKLESTAQKFYEARDKMFDIWNLCKKHIKEE
ncbi:hypothetical protein A3K82_03185 [Candidatus Pacearchaeota archaeon RBG_19FT_COMBO_34_9]|nr:MAG: hypothetical protein A3K82_03185 [Candidatus Pacearchaeota archaeon RBG_19FT_COMBO_34_9]OGJ17057.1 MAG: hypothetical protein A3K74_01565 [Candidatus Pacearchaeota archaeon RBG_13_33_26]